MTTTTLKAKVSSRVLETSTADPKVANNHFQSRLAFETDPSDVYTDLQNGETGFVVLDARTIESYSKGHVPGAISFPYRKIDSTTVSPLPRNKVIVTYCDGVYCNASTKAAAKLTGLGFRVKEMLDGMEGWRKEGYAIEETVMQVTVSA